MKAGRTRLLISCVLMTLSMLAILPLSMRLLATWRERTFQVTPKYFIENYLAPQGFSSLALICIGLIVTWTGFKSGQRSAWLILFLLGALFYFPVITVPASRINWEIYLESLSTSQTLQEYTFHLLGSLSIAVALLLPIADFFSRRESDPRERAPVPRNNP